MKRTLFLFAISVVGPFAQAADHAVDQQLAAVLKSWGFTGTTESQLPARLGRQVDTVLADLGRSLFFDKIMNLHGDNSCSGCHTPQVGFGDTQSIAIGIQNNGYVGPDRSGPRNQRRTPMLVNDAFFPKLMWNGRFSSISGDPFDNSKGFLFPDPEGAVRFPPNDPVIKHLLAAQAHMPPTELTEAAGYTGTRGTIGPDFDQFDDGLGDPVPAPDASGFRNEPIRQAVLKLLNQSAAYRALFAKSFPEVAAGAPIDFTMIGRAIAEFQFTLVFANAPVDQFARGDHSAMTASQKRGALLFFGEAGCVTCHAVSGQSNEMFSDFVNHCIGVPQITPAFGAGKGNVAFDGDNQDEDFGAEQISFDSKDRYDFRTSPLRNIALQPAFFHDGAFTRLEDAIEHHLNVTRSLRQYDPTAAGMPPDLSVHVAAFEPMLSRIDREVAAPRKLSFNQFQDLVEFVRNGLLDPRAKPENLCKLIPTSLPSGMQIQVFEGCLGNR